MTSVVIGNGVSRKSIDLNSLKFTTYGCNALYRDFKPDYLIAVDSVMIDEFVKNKVDETHNIYTTYLIQTKGKFNYFSKHTGMNSGHTACWLAANQHKHEIVYMLGFDYVGIDGKFNNVYSDTFNYRKSTDKETPYTKWYVELKNLLESSPNTKFIRIVGNNHYLKLQEKNFTEITIEQFKEINK